MYTMQRLTAVDEAKALFEEAKEWGVWQWLTGKTKARQTADAAWEALEEYEKNVKSKWSAEQRKNWKACGGAEAERKAHQAHLDAEAHFDEADRRMSTSMACEGSQMAIDAWTLREKLIRRMEALGRRS